MAGSGKVKAVIFDLDDTLVLTHEADEAAKLAVMELAGVRYASIRRQHLCEQFWKQFISQPWDPHAQVDVTEWRAQLWSRALEEQGVHDIALARELQNCFDLTRMTAFKWAPGVKEIVETLHDQGIKTGIITNGHPKVQRAKLEAAEASKLFSVILVGGEEEHEKPHASIFIKACELLGVKPEESVMVGDNLKTDILGAKNANFMAAVWVNVHGLSEITNGPASPDHVIPEIQQLPRVLSLLI